MRGQPCVHMRQEIKELQKRTGVTILFVTHDQQEAMSMSDRIVVMNHGKIEQQGTPKDIYRNPAYSFVADFVGKTNLISVQAEAGEGKLVWPAGGIRFSLPPGTR